MEEGGRVAAPTVTAERRRRRLGRRILSDVVSGVFVMWGAATLTFGVFHLMPGNAAIAIAGGVASHPTHAQIEAVTQQYGLNKPTIVQYFVYLGQLLQGHLGFSSSQKLPVSTVIAQNIGPTLLLMASALVFAWLLAIASTVLTVKWSRFGSSIGSGLEVLGASLPQYWLGIILLEVFAFNLRWFPATGGTGWVGLVLPGLTLAIPLAGFLAQVTREEFESALEQPFIVTARARGMGSWGVRVKHALRHAILPGITLSGWAIGSLVSGAVIIETLFSRQGLGNQLLQAVTQQDPPLTIGITLIVALAYVAANLFVDALYLVADPRLRASQ
jgi:peptide/nickel transport system permease protein